MADRKSGDRTQEQEDEAEAEDADDEDDDELADLLGDISMLHDSDRVRSQ